MGSGAIEAGVRIVNNERLKNACMHWSVASARAVLALGSRSAVKNVGFSR